MSHLPPSKGRTLTYSELRAIRDAGASAYRWFEESVYAEHSVTPAISLDLARRINAALSAVLASAVVVVIAYAAGTVAGIVAAVAVVAAAALPRPVATFTLSAWMWPVLAGAAASAAPTWAALTVLALVATPTVWWPRLALLAVAGACAARLTPLVFIAPCALVIIGAVISARWTPVQRRAGIVTNLTASWKRPALNTDTLHKPLPPQTLPWFVLVLNRKIRQIIREARKNLDEQTRPLPDQWRAKIVGAIGERTTAMTLLGLPRNRWLLAHDLQVPGETSTANIDHVIIGASGVWVVDAKQYSGSIAVSDNAIRHGEKDLTPTLRTLAWEAGRLSLALNSHVRAVMLVPPKVCTHPIVVTAPAVKDIPETTIVILTKRHLQDWLASQPSTVTATDRARIAGRLLSSTQGAYGAGTTPHLTYSRGLSYSQPPASLASHEHTLRRNTPPRTSYRRGQR